MVDHKCNSLYILPGSANGIIRAMQNYLFLDARGLSIYPVAILEVRWFFTEKKDSSRTSDLMVEGLRPVLYMW